MTFEQLLEKYDSINPSVVGEIYHAGMDKAAEIYTGDRAKDRAKNKETDNDDHDCHKSEEDGCVCDEEGDWAADRPEITRI